MNSKSEWRAWLAGGAILAAFGPMLFFYFRQQWGRPEYQAFPVVITAALVLLWMRLKEADAVKRWSKTVTVLSFLSVLIGLLLLFLSYWVFSPWLAMAAFIVTTFGLSAKVWQYRKVSGLWGIWAMQFLLLPPPLDRDQMFIEYLQLSSSKLTSVVLDSLGVLHLMQGNALKFADRDFFVDEACSGIVSLISVLSIIAIYCLWKRYRIGASVFLMLCGGIWAVLMNTVRLTTIAVAWYYYKVDLAEGVPHTAVAVGVFMLSLGVLFIMAKFAAYWFDPIVLLTEQEGQRSASQNRMVDFWNRWIANEPDVESDSENLTYRGGGVPEIFVNSSVFGPPVMAFVGVLGVLLALTYISFESKNAEEIETSLMKALKIDQDFAFPSGQFTTTSFSNDRRDLFRWDRWGQHSRTFNFQDETGVEYIISCDFMFGPHWHDLRKCYRGTGWKIYQETVTFATDLGDEAKFAGRQVTDSLIPDWTVERFHIRRDDSSQKGFVAFAAFRADGQVFNRPRGDGLFSNFWAHLVQGRDRAEQADYFQVQVSTFANTEVSEKQCLQAEKLLALALDKFKSEIVTSTATQSQIVAN